MGRLPLHRVPRRRRDRARQPQRAAAHPLLPRAARAAGAGRCPTRCVVDGEIVVAGARRARLRRAAAAHPPGRVAGQAAERRDAGVVRGLRPARPRRPRPAWTSRSRERRALLAEALAGADPPVHLTPATTDRDHGRRLVRALRGRRPRRRDGQAARRHLRAQQAGAVQGEAQAHRRLRGGRVPHAQGRRRRRLAAARPVRRRGPRCTTSAWRRASPPAAARSCWTSWRPTSRTPSTTTRGGEWAEAEARAADRRHSACPAAVSRWNAKKDLCWTPLRPELVAEVAYEQVQNGRFRHSARLLHWRPDRDAGLVHLRPARGRAAPSSWPRSSRPEPDLPTSTIRGGQMGGWWDRGREIGRSAGPKEVSHG